MPVYGSFSLVRWEDGVLAVNLYPPVDIGGAELRLTVTRHPGPNSSGLITKTCNSGYGGGQSGITITNSGEGVFAAAINSADTSGLDAGVYFYSVERLSSGRVELAAGEFLIPISPML